MDSGAFSISGPKGNNQDSFLEPVVKAGFTLAAVADGLGGHADGQLASETAIRALLAFFERDPSRPLSEAVAFVRDELSTTAERYPLSSSMGTTLSAIRLCDGKADVVHVGDTRIYHLRGGGLISRTIDQTEVAELVRQNVFTAEEALRYPRRNVLLSSLSPNKEYDLFSSQFEVLGGDLIVLCSDGLYNTIKKQELVEISNVHQNPSHFCDLVRHRAEIVGLKDDATMVALRV